MDIIDPSGNPAISSRAQQSLSAEQEYLRLQQGEKYLLQINKTTELLRQQGKTWNEVNEALIKTYPSQLAFIKDNTELGKKIKDVNKDVTAFAQGIQSLTGIKNISLKDFPNKLMDSLFGGIKSVSGKALKAFSEGGLKNVFKNVNVGELALAAGEVGVVIDALETLGDIINSLGEMARNTAPVFQQTGELMAGTFDSSSKDFEDVTMSAADLNKKLTALNIGMKEQSKIRNEMLVAFPLAGGGGKPLSALSYNAAIMEAGFGTSGANLYKNLVQSGYTGQQAVKIGEKTAENFRKQNAVLPQATEMLSDLYDVGRFLNTSFGDSIKIVDKWNNSVITGIFAAKDFAKFMQAQTTIPFGEEAKVMALAQSRGIPLLPILKGKSAAEQEFILHTNQAAYSDMIQRVIPKIIESQSKYTRIPFAQSALGSFISGYSPKALSAIYAGTYDYYVSKAGAEKVVKAIDKTKEKNSEAEEALHLLALAAGPAALAANEFGAALDAVIAGFGVTLNRTINFVAPPHTRSGNK